MRRGGKSYYALDVTLPETPKLMWSISNSGDFVEVFTAGKYETDQAARWSDGDWNSDERFDSSDFVAVLMGFN